MPDASQVYREAQAYREQTVAYYRQLHRKPETAHNEVETHRFLRGELTRLGIAFEAPAPNITVGVIDGGLPGATVGLRCDTDALPVQEQTGLPFASENPGVMHACGHDAHMAAGLAAAWLLTKRMGRWMGRVKLVFQPAEEGEAGAAEVIATGLVDDVDVFFGLHVWSPYPSGELRVAPVTVSAAVDMFSIELHGKGGHGATPERCDDALVAGAALVTALQSIVSRRVSPMDEAVLTVGSFHAGTVGNIIAQDARLRGTVRSLNEQVRRRILQEMERMTRQIAEAYGCEGVLHNRRISGVLTNDARACAIARECAEALVGRERVGGQQAMMLGDDFADYGAVAPYCYGQVGIADPLKQTDYAHHNGRFRVDEDVLPLCAAWMALVSVRLAAEWKDGKR